MTNILHLTASIRGAESISRTLSSDLVAKLAKQGETTIVERDLSANDLPFIDEQRFAANLAPHAERSPDQADLAAIADTLIAELEQADIFVLGVPIYNFSMPSTVKAWADLVARAGTTFKYNSQGPVGLLEGKKAYIAVASGGTVVDSDIDFMTPWLRHFLGFIGITDVEVVAADAIMAGDADEKVAAAKEKIVEALA